MACDAVPIAGAIAQVDPAASRAEIFGRPASARKRRVQLVVLEADGPGHDAWGLLEDAARSLDQAALLVVSDRREGRSVLKAMRAGASGYVVRPGDLRHLTEAIEKTLSGGRWFSGSAQDAASLALTARTRAAQEKQSLARALTRRQKDCLKMLARGLTVKEMAKSLSIAPKTVEGHLTSLYRSLGVKNRLQAVAKAYRTGLIQFD